MTCPTDCQYSKDVGMWPEHRCAVKCQYATPPPAPTAAEQAQPVTVQVWTEVARLMRCIDAYAYDYDKLGKVAGSRFEVERELCAALATPVPEQAQPAGVTEDARDAARYRWLRERNAVMDSFPIFTACRITASDGTFSHNELICFEQMDAAIDAARAQEGEKP